MNLLVIYIFIVVKHIKLTDSLPNKNDMIKGSGKFHVGGIFPITIDETNGIVDVQNGVMMAEAMRYAIQVVNNESDYLQGYQLEIQNIFDSVGEKAVRKAILDNYLDLSGFLIGPYSSETSYLSSILTDTFEILAFSYSATYGDFGRFGQTHQEFMYRTVPSDEFRILAVLNFIKESHWNYVSIISSHGYDGERDAMDFISKLSEYGVCLASQFNLPKFKGPGRSYKDAVSQIKLQNRLKAIILFTTNEDSHNIFKELKQQGLKDRFQILCVYGCTNYVNVLKGNEEIANNTLSLYLHNPEVQGFKEYYFKLKPGLRQNPQYFNNFWENVFQCSLNKKFLKDYAHVCNGTEKLSETKGYYKQTPVHTVIDAVFNLAKVLKIFIYAYCNQRFYDHSKFNITTCNIEPNDTHLVTDRVKRHFLQDVIFDDGTFKTSEYGLLDLLENVFESTVVRYDVSHYHYIKEGTSDNQLIWKWELTRKNNTKVKNVENKKLFQTQWLILGESDHESISSKGVCSSKCPPGFYMDYDPNYLKSKCCWECRKCSRNSIVDNNTCVTCKKTEFVDDEFEQCLSLPIKGLSWRSNILSIIFILFTVFGLCLTASVGTVFTVFSKNRIVRASGRDLCYTILAGICLIFICPFTFLATTNRVTCILRGAFPGFAFLTCYAPLFLKTNRIYRIFFSARVSVTRPSLVSSQSQFFALFSVLTVQLIISVVWFSSKTPFPESIVALDRSHVTVHCSSDTNPVLLILNLSLSVLFMICCTVLAFKTRHFPKNYNEAKHIGITLYITCVAWAVFLPTYFLAPSMKSEFLREYLMCAQCILIGYITLFGMFGPKMIMIYQSPPQTSGQGSLPTWYVTGSLSKEDSKDGYDAYPENGNCENTCLNTITENQETAKV